MKYAIVTMIGMVVIAGCVTLHCMDTLETPETPPADDNLYLDDLVVEVPERAFVKGKIQPSTQRDGVKRIWIRSGMPCDLYQGETDEQETSEEVVSWERSETETVAVSETLCAVYEPETQTVPEIHTTAQAMDAGTEPVTTAPEDIPEGDAEVPADDVPTGGMDDDCPEGDAMVLGDLEQYLRTLLVDSGYEFFYPYAWCQIQQESHWDPTAQNVNGLDKGLLQYRITYYPGQNIFDPYEQIRIYVGQVSARINAGLSVEAVISRHITSDWVTEINWEYVNHVLSHMN